MEQKETGPITYHENIILSAAGFATFYTSWAHLSYCQVVSKILLNI